MRAAVYHGPEDIRVEEVADKKPKEDEVLIAVRYCGVCGTDINIYKGMNGAFTVTPPLIPGHEFSGVVKEVGSKVKNVKPGDRVTADPNDMCGACYFCSNAMEQFCTDNIGIGTTADGGFAQYTVVHSKQVYKIADSLDFMTAAMTEPMSCCLHGIDLCRIKDGDTVLVMGGGPIGMIMLQLAAMAGATQVILSEPVQEKRDLAKKLGATLTIDPTKENVKKILTDNFENVNCVIECIGNVHTQADAVRFAGMGATVMLFGLSGEGNTFPLDANEVFKKELHITSSFINPYTFSRAVKVLESGRVDVRSIITTVLPLDEITEVFSNPELRRAGKAMIKIGSD